jgi:hypothetical protein
MYKSIIDYELKEGNIHNNFYTDGSSKKDWSPEMGNYGALFTPLVEGVLGLEPKAYGLWISPFLLEGMNRLKLRRPQVTWVKIFILKFPGKATNLDRWNSTEKHCLLSQKVYCYAQRILKKIPDEYSITKPCLENRFKLK